MTRALSSHAAFFAAGLLASASQVLLLRERVVDAAGDEAAIGIGLAGWLAGIAGGAAVARHRPPPRAAADAGRGLALLVLCALGGMVGGRLLRLQLAPDPGELPGLGLALGLALSTLAPSGVAVGWTFTALSSSASHRWSAGEGITRVYVAESLGSLAGGLLVTLLAGSGVSVMRQAAGFGTVAALLGLLAPRPTLAGRRTLGAALLVAVALFAFARPVDERTEGARFAAIAPAMPLRAFLDTPWQHVDLGGDDVYSLYSSGHFVSSFPDPWAAESLGHLLAVLAPHPARVLLLGGGERGIVPVLLRHPVSALTLVEPDARATAALERWLPPADRAARGDPRVRVVADDPRRFVSRTGSGLFDLVVLPGDTPDTLLRARLCTVEFFRLVAARLAPDGVLVVGLRTAPGALTGDTAALAGSLVLSIREALPVARVTPGPDALVVAGWTPEAATLDPAALARRWTERAVASESFDAAVLPALLPPDRVATEEEAVERAARTATASHDDRPVSFAHALARRHREAAGPWGRLVVAAVSLPPLALVVLAFAPSLLALGWSARPAARAARGRAAATHAVAVAGAAGMGWSLLVLFSFQTQVGMLHGRLGVLVALFMLGLSVGAMLGRRATRVGEGTSGKRPAASRALARALGAAVVLGATLPLTLGLAARAADRSALLAVLAFGTLQLAAGLATGAVFPIAAVVCLGAGDDAGGAAGRVEAADHAGAALAALVAVVVLVPRLGIAHVALLLAAMLAAALLAIALTAAATTRGATRLGLHTSPDHRHSPDRGR
jgi:spermidine synthase